MEQVPRFFTVDEANALVSRLEFEFGRVASIRSELGPLIDAVGGVETAVAILQENADGPLGHEAEAERLRRCAAEIGEAVDRVNGLGCLVKDLDAGLVDFYAMQDGEPVFLCWQYGEPAVSHWHGVEEGFAGRRPIEGTSTKPTEFVN